LFFQYSEDNAKFKAKIEKSDERTPTKPEKLEVEAIYDFDAKNDFS